MKYVLLCFVALAVCLVCAGVPAILIGRAKKYKRRTTIFIAIGILVLLICVVSLGYLEIYYHADSSADVTSPVVQVEKIDGGYLFDGPGENVALIFYPGAKVETIAYAPLMTSLAENGVDCFLADMPFRMAMFGADVADKFIDKYNYEKWAIAGHSLGGVFGSRYAASHSDRVDYLILLASFPNGEIPDNIELCSIYGDKDGCLGLESYEKAKSYWPTLSTEVVIEGGNHAQYANYGPQSGDNEADISRDEQQSETVNAILKLVLFK